jgi:hypothetical protein
MQYRILSLSAPTGELFVSYEGYRMLVVPLPLTAEGLYITGPELDTYLKDYVVHEQIRYAAISAGIPNESEIHRLCDSVTIADFGTAPELIEAAAAASLGPVVVL